MLLFSETMKKNKKYEDLLLKSYEKYRGIDVIDKYHDCETSEIGEEIESVLPWRTDKTTRSNSPRKGPQKHGNYLGRKYRVFLHHEDDILLEAIRTASQSNPVSGEVTRLSKLLNREYASVRDRIAYLKAGKRKRIRKAYTLNEDKLIVDHILDILPSSGKDIRSVAILKEDFNDVSLILKRKRKSVMERWNRVMLPIVLSYHEKTLNLDIRMLFLNHLADTYDSVSSIDWDEVLKKKEFSGQTKASLRNILSTQVRLASEFLSQPKNVISFKQMAVAAASYMNDQRLEIVRNKRKTDLIKYFDRMCWKKNLDIKQYLK